MSNRNGTDVVRELQLKRRRSRVPWMYLVYHVRESGHGDDEMAQRPQRAGRSVYPGNSETIEVTAPHLSNPMGSVACVASELIASVISVASIPRSAASEMRARRAGIPVRTRRPG